MQSCISDESLATCVNLTDSVGFHVRSLEHLPLDHFSTLPCLKLFLVVCVFVTSCERSFSKEKLIKIYLRSTTEQLLLISFSVLSIHNRVAHGTDFDNKHIASLHVPKKKFFLVVLFERFFFLLTLKKKMDFGQLNALIFA